MLVSSYTWVMSRDGNSIREKATNVQDSSRNKRQASVLLSEVARHNCDRAKEEIMKESSRLIERTKQLRARAKELRSQKAS